MITQPTDIEKAVILAQILKSPGFQDSKKHQDLLKFLVERPTASSPLKETEIASEVFGKDSKFDPTVDSLIRSYISNLRKKLDHYYLTTEDTYSYKVEIPKGHYLIKFSIPEPKPAAKQIIKIFPAVKTVSWFVLMLLVIVLSFREFGRQTAPAGTQQTTVNNLWNDFLQPNARQTLVVLGDFFFLRERYRTDGFYRTVKINSIDEYLDSINHNPEFGRLYTKNNFTYLRPSASWCLVEILPILQKAANGFNLKLASEFNADDLKTNNVIFIGSFKTLYNLKNFLNVFKLDYNVAPSSFRIRDGNSDSLHLFKPERLSAGRVEKDYGIVAKGQGPNHSTIMMLLGFSESGVLQAVQAACNPMLFKTILDKYPSGSSLNPSALTIVMGAEGITQSLFDADIRYVAGLGAPRSIAHPMPADSVK